MQFEKLKKAIPLVILAGTLIVGAWVKQDSTAREAASSQPGQPQRTATPSMSRLRTWWRVK